MSAATRPEMTPDQSDHWHEGYRTGRNASAYLLRSMASEADKPTARATLAEAARRVDAMPMPRCTVVLRRAQSLEGAIRAALAVSSEGLGPEALAILKDGIR